MPSVTQAWSYIAGEKGVNRVRVFAHPRTGTLFLEFRDQGRKARQALGHRDEAKGKAQADELAARLRQPSTDPDRRTLQELFDMYLREVTPGHTPARQSEHRRFARGILAEVKGETLVRDLTHAHARRYVARRRREGNRSAAPGAQGRAIGTRGLQQELGWWRTVLRWGVGEGLCSANPLEGYELTNLKPPRRPLVNESDYQARVAVADQVGAGPAPTACHLFLRLVHDTGHRGKAARFVRWNDIDLERGLVRWDGGRDKGGWEHATPLTLELVELLKARRRIAPAIGDAFVFESPRRPGEPLGRTVPRDWWYELTEKAGLVHHAGEGFHSLRRKFATELKDIPLPDLAALGGWRDTQTILRCYQQSDPETMRRALAQRKARG